MFKRLLGAVAFALLFSGCSTIYEDIGDLGETLADLKPVVLPPDPPPIEKASIRDIEQSYRAALEVASDPAIRHRILVRLADMEMAHSEEVQLTSTDADKHFDAAISMYDELLQLSETKADGATDERLLYRLSKAYALDGKLDESDAILAQLVNSYPDSDYKVEAEFRRAEQAFRIKDYSLAETFYTRVANAGDQTPFYLNSIYMQGWSKFKQNNYRGAVQPFTAVLDKVLVEGAALDTISGSQQSLATDTLRVMGFAFSYLEGATSITEIYNTLGARHYQHLLYSQLGNLYLEKKRFKDAANTYQHYIDYFPDSVHGPGFAVHMMDVYKQGNFPSLILPAKEGFIRQYGINSTYWANHTEEYREVLRPHLKVFLDEVSSYYHAEGQGIKKALRKKLSAKARKKLGRPQPSFLKAASYYAEYMKTFPKDVGVAEKTYLMADALSSAEQLIDAVAAYDKVAYTLLDKKYGADAGYASLLLSKRLVKITTDKEKSLRKRQASPEVVVQLDAAMKEKNTWLAHQTKSAIDFADYFPGDKRAVAVLTNAAEEIFKSGDKEQAIVVALRLTQWVPMPDLELQKTAWLVLAHSQFDLEKYDEAEVSYRKILTLLQTTDPKYPQIIERIAASMFKSAELLIASDKKLEGVERLLQIGNVSPGSTIAKNAQYDAGNYLMELKAWQRAELVFVDFAKRFPKHSLAPTVVPKLALIYQELKLWDKAAAQLAIMSKTNNDPETKRSSLYLSAQLYQKSGRSTKAIAIYKEYIKKYPMPFDLAIEARFQLVEMYGVAREDYKRDFWLKKLIKEDAAAGNNRTERSRYLAAFASAKFAKDTHRKFDRIKLTVPIKKSLKAKKKALDKALSAYKKVIDYGVAEFATAANHHIGEVYAQLHKDLLDSERPKGLDELAMEQYEILLEETSYPFKKKAISMLTVNAERSWEGFYDEWVKKSFSALAKLLPARYGKKEAKLEVSRGLH